MSDNILNKIVEAAKIRVEAAKKIKSLQNIKNAAESLITNTQIGKFEKAISKNNGRMNLICEIKKKSPSKGIIDEEFDYLKILSDYEKGGAAAISVLTEPDYFLGSNKIFTDCRKQTGLPLLRKDFTVDEYMLYEAKILGADAVLLIVSILSDSQLKQYLEICEKLNLDALIETHGKEEIERAVKAGGRIIGVNNRNLTDFSVDVNNARRLKKFVPGSCIFVAESGVTTVNDTKTLYESGINSALIGEACMRAKDRISFVQSLSNMI